MDKTDDENSIPKISEKKKTFFQNIKGVSSGIVSGAAKAAKFGVSGAAKAAKMGGKLIPIKGITNLFRVDEEEDEKD